MTTQEKINRLANAALHAAPPSAAFPKSAIFTPLPENLRIPTVAVEVANANVTDAPVFQAVVEAPAAKVPDHQTDPELGALIEERDARMKKKHSRQLLYANLTILGILASGGLWYACSTKAQTAVKSLIPAIRQSGNDFKMLGSILGQFDQSLQKVATRSSQIDEASRSIGADPNAAGAKDDPQMEGEMNQLTGGEGGTTAARDRALKEKFGIVTNLAGDKGKLGQEESSPPEP
ncbi:MAG: hypothetical protein ABI162_02830 [Luteolibacter sp.]